MNDLTRPNVQKTFEIIKNYCKPRYDFDKEPFQVLNLFFQKPSNFQGGCNDPRNTLHENMFSLMFPEYKKQISFGTGLLGFKKYGIKRYIVDFYDFENKKAYEVNGKLHYSELGRLKDKYKASILWAEHGIKLFEISNKDVERLLISRLENLDREGKLDAY